MILFIFCTLLLQSVGFVFSDRNHTHLLFEYLFLQSECEKGFFNPHTLVNGTSFGVLQIESALRCLERSGYRNTLMKDKVSAKSNGTLKGFLERIYLTKEFSVELWMYHEFNYNCVDNVFMIGEWDTSIEDNDVSLQLMVMSSNFYIKRVNSTYDAFYLTHYVNMKPMQLVITVQLEDNVTYYSSYINGTLFNQYESAPLSLSTWNENHHLILSSPQLYTHSSQWFDELYYLGFYDHILSADQVYHNFLCSLPPSLASITLQQVHGNMNERFFVNVTVSDFNIETNTNMIPDYSVQLILYSLPHCGQLFSVSMQPIIEVPLSGLALNGTSFYFQGETGDYSDSAYANITLGVQNPYGISNPVVFYLYVDWVNSPPVTSNQSFSLVTDSVLSVDIDVIDVDGDVSYTRFITLPTACSILSLPESSYMNQTHFDIAFLGDDSHSNSCLVQFVVGDSNGLESNITSYTFQVENRLQPTTTFVRVYQNQMTNITLSFFLSNQLITTSNYTVDIITEPRYGSFSLVDNNLSYRSHEFYFSYPTLDVSGNHLNHDNDSIQYIVYHKSIPSEIFNLQIEIMHVNTPPQLVAPNSFSFYIYESVPISNVMITDQDYNTNICQLEITTTTGFFTLNTTSADASNSITWIEGNYGEGRDDNRLVADGSLSAINYSLHTLAYKAIYRLNDTLVIQITDGEYAVKQEIKMIYMPEQTTVITPKFTIIVCLVIGLMILWILTLCYKMCPHRKNLPIQKDAETTKQPIKEKKKAPPPPTSLPPPLHKKESQAVELNIVSKKTVKPPVVS